MKYFDCLFYLTTFDQIWPISKHAIFTRHNGRLAYAFGSNQLVMCYAEKEVLLARIKQSTNANGNEEQQERSKYLFL